ncbi:MAG TPA: AAA family ATPase [Ktedonobacterales bacterium]
MFRRQNNTTATATGTGATSSAPQGALAGPGALLRRADWERLDVAARDQLLAPYQAPTLPAEGGGGSPDRSTDVPTQTWVARLVATGFQPEVAAIVGDWLAIAPPDGHLYVGGGPGYGRTSLVAGLAREAMRTRPAPPDLCYVPGGSALDQAELVPLPHGQGAPFMEALFGGLSRICQGWSPENSGDGSASNGNTSDGHDGNAGNGSAPAPAPMPAAQAAPAPDRAQLVAASLGAVEQGAPAEAQPYLRRLRDIFGVLIASGDTPALCKGGDVPAGLIVSDDALDDQGKPLESGAPVVVVPIAQMALPEALRRANGGVLVLQAADVVGDTWAALVSVLRSGQLPHKEDGWPPIPIAVRVVLVGSGDAYQALDNAGDDFARLFRYEAWCPTDLRWTPQAEAAYATLARGAATRHKLPDFAPSGVARLVEEGARRSQGLNRGRLTANLLTLHDIAVEAGRGALARGAANTEGLDVDTTVQRRRTLQGVAAQRVLDTILTGQENTPTTGRCIGLINGLGIYESRPAEGSFAVPMRISATVSPGRDEKLVDIEAIASAADASHVRGALTAEGYLNYRYAQERPLNTTIRIRFEQEHGATGGDSASAAILFALLSALAQVEINASLAITGAVGQYGEVQPIGGVNTKIEGFWALCRARRTTTGEQPTGGRYGVLIPATNVRDLMLHPEVADSIEREGWFAVWPISTVDQGLALLTGVPAEQIHARVAARLQRFTAIERRARG